MKRKDGLGLDAVKDGITTIIDKNGSGNWRLLVQGELSIASNFTVFFINLNVNQSINVMLRPRVQTYQAESGTGPVLGLRPGKLDSSENSHNKDAEWFV